MTTSTLDRRIWLALCVAGVVAVLGLAAFVVGMSRQVTVTTTQGTATCFVGGGGAITTDEGAIDERHPDCDAATRDAELLVAGGIAGVGLGLTTAWAAAIVHHRRTRGGGTGLS